MKKFALLLCVVSLSACATPAPIPQDVKDKVALIPVAELPHSISLEKMRCPKSRYHIFDKRMECKTAIRRDLAARKMMSEQNNTEEQSNEAIKN